METNISQRLIASGVIAVALSTGIVLSLVLGFTALFPVLYVIMVTFAMVHGAKRYGWKLMWVFLALVLGISWGYESLSIMTGFPFGNYHYSEAFIGPFIGLVPVMIMPAYFAMGYFSWTIASILLDKKDAVLRKADIILQPLLASFVMVMWDLSFDPATSTIGQFWVWHDGGAYFGVPFVNYLGWFLCVFTFYMIFALIVSKNTGSLLQNKINSVWFWVLPILMYLTRTIEYVANQFTRENVQITSNDGHVWWTGDIYASLLLVSMFTMMFVGFYAIVRAFKNRDS